MENSIFATLNKVIDSHNNEQTVEYLTKHFRSRGLNKTTPSLVFAKVVTLDKLSQTELICLAEGLYSFTGMEEVNPKNLFDSEELEVYHELQEQTDYYPTTIATQRILDYKDRKILDFLK